MVQVNKANQLFPSTTSITLWWNKANGETQSKERHHARILHGHSAVLPAYVFNNGDLNHATGPFRSFSVTQTSKTIEERSVVHITGATQLYVCSRTQDKCQNKHPWKVNTLRWFRVCCLSAMSTSRKPRHHKSASSFHNTDCTDDLHEVHDDLATTSLRIWQQDAKHAFKNQTQI